MADLKLTADFTDLQTLKRELLDIPKKARDSARTFEAEYARVERALVRQAKQFEKNASESQKYYSELLKLSQESKSAERSAQIFTRELEKQEQAARRAGKAFRDQTTRAVRELAQEFARTGDQSAYLRGINKIVSAQERLKDGARMSRSEIMRLGNEFRQQADFAEQLAAAQVRADVATQGATRGLNRSGVVMQQTGYQVGDFLVQVQSGTNALVAFGQQATQLAGLLTLSMNPGMIALGTALGIAIPLVTAIGAAFMRTRDAAENAQDMFEGLAATLDRLEDIRLEGIGSSLADGAREAMREWRPVLDMLERVELRELQQNLSSNIENVVRQLASASNQLQPRTFMPGVQSLLGMPRDLPSGIGAFGLDTAEQLQEVARAISAIEGQTRAELQESLRLTQERLGAQQLLTPEVESLLARLAEELGLVESITAQTEATGEAIQGNARAAEDFMQSLSDAYTFLREQAESIGDAFKQDTAEAVAEFEQKVAEAAEEARALKQGMAEAKRDAEALARLDLAGGVSAAAEEAKTLAQYLGISFRQAAGLVALGSQGVPSNAPEDGLVGSGRGAGPQGPLVGTAETTVAALVSGRAFTGIPDITSGRRSGGGGGGVNPIDQAREAFDRLRESYDEQFAAAQRVAQAQEVVNNALQLGIIDASTAEQTMRDYIASLEDAQTPMADFANNAARQMADGFMSIIDGSKSASDAFKDMARQIIAQALRMAVINPIINSIFGGFGGFNPLPTLFANAKGNIFSNGSVVPFANGGVVNSPVTFPMTGGRTGLMGEAGPEAIMPLKRGPDGKLGVAGGGNVTIHQTFQFSANGDDSVKRIIAQEAPKIAALTQKQIVDQRRRGGAMKGAFG